MDEEEKLQRKMSLSQTFNPGAPISRIELFAGRIEQLTLVINTINQTGQHAIIYGERGVGKTSLASVLSDFFEKQFEDEKWLRYVRVNCDTDDSFNSIWKKVFRELSIVYEKKSIGFIGEIEEISRSLESLIDDETKPEDIRYLLERLGGLHIIVIDEFDRVQERHVTSLIADTIKSFSDHLLKATLILVGVADAIDELIEEHLSIERSMVQIPMPRMSEDELEQIIINGLDRVEMEIEEIAKNRIIQLSQGLPHFTHLFSLYASQIAVDEERSKVSIQDVEGALEKSVEHTQLSIQRKCHQATSSPRETLYPQVLLACALAKTDMLGYFAATDVREPLSIIMGRNYDIPAFSRHLNDFCEDSRGSVFEKIGEPRRYRFRFMNPLLQPFVIMIGLSSGLIEFEEINKIYNGVDSAQRLS